MTDPKLLATASGGAPTQAGASSAFSRLPLYSSPTAPTTPPPATQPPARFATDPGVAAAERFLTDFQKPETAAQIADRKRQQSQGLIDSLNTTYDAELEQAKERGTGRLRERNALSIFSGLAGSPEGQARREEVQGANEKEQQAINNRRVLDLERIYTDISASAEREAREQIADATRSAEAILARGKERQTQATEQLKIMASSGLVDFESFRTNPQNSKVYQYALEAVGGSEDALKGLFALNRPQETVVASKWFGNTFFQVYRNPITGETKTEAVDLGALGYDIPRGYSKSIDLGGQVMLIPEDFDPTKDKPFYISKSLTPAQGANAAPGGTPGYKPLNLDDAQIDRLNTLGLSSVQQELVSAIMRGESPPIPPSNPRTKDIQMVLGGLASLGYDNTKAVQDWTSMQKRLQSMNSTQQLRLSQAVFALEGSTQQAERLYAEWQATGLPTGYSTANRAALAVASRLPGEAGTAARTLTSHIEDMAAELAVIYRGGNSPTDQAFEAARKSLNEDWNPAQFAKNLELIRQNLRIRQNSLVNSAQVAGNIYSPDPQPMQDIFSGGNIVTAPDGTQVEIID